jgi:hypothetical protein
VTVDAFVNVSFAGRHTPAWHELPAVHTVPHAPQLLLFVIRSTHMPEQLICPEIGHIGATHAPAEHTGVAPEHAVVHEPQCIGSVESVAHAEPQSV